jgi:8-oxo-dGTP diphosphatase
VTIGRFTAGIGALIVDESDDRYLVLKRSMEKDFAAGAWECVTGRVDQGEGFEDALHREVREELGIEVAPLFIIGTTHFHRGVERPENELLGVVYCCSGSRRQALRLSQEHTEYRWIGPHEVEQLADGNNPSEEWLIRIVKRAEIMRKNHPAVLTALYRREGFELDTE